MFGEHENCLSRWKNVVLNEKSVERKPCINRESKSDELTITLYSCHDINVKFLLVVTPPSIYQFPCERAKQLHLGRISNMVGQKYRSLPRSQCRGRVHNNSTIGEYLGGIGGGLAAMLMFPTLSAATRGPSCCMYGTVWFGCVC